jgi:multiple sugar transport system ATP-binding protein
VFLFDEPLSNLDAALRVDMRMEIARLHQDLGATMVYVTHDQIEAMTLADRIVVLDQGRVMQVGAPLELYHRPANLFVAGFIGSPKMNFLPVRALSRSGGRIEVGSQDLGATAFELAGPPGEVADELTLGIRPQAMTLADPAAAPIRGTVDIVEHLGDETVLNARLPGGGSVLAIVEGDAILAPGQPVGLSFDLSRAHLFLPSGLRLETASPRAVAA